MQNLINTVDRVVQKRDRELIEQQNLRAAARVAAGYIMDVLEDPIAFANLTPELLTAIICASVNDRKEL